MIAENPTVAALSLLSIFSANQGGAYREHYAKLAEVLGSDVDTRLGGYVREWARSGVTGAVLLTGNAGTGKTAVAEVYCRVLGTDLPTEDSLFEVKTGYVVIKDLSGLPNASRRDTNY